MKRLLFLLSLILTIQTFAQNRGELVISEIKGGTMQLQDGKERKELKVGNRIEGTSIILLDEKTTVVILEPQLLMRYTLKGAYTGSVRNYIQRNEKSSIWPIGKKYMNYLLSQALKGHHESKESEETSHATVFRKTDLLDDSVTISVQGMDSLYHTIDSLSAVTADTLKIVPKKVDPMKAVLDKAASEGVEAKMEKLKKEADKKNKDKKKKDKDKKSKGK